MKSARWRKRALVLLVWCVMFALVWKGLKMWDGGQFGMFPYIHLFGEWYKLPGW